MAILRWLLVVPGALLGALLGGAAFKLLNIITGPFDSSLFSALLDLGGSWVTGALAVLLAMKIAPSHRSRVGLIAGAVVLVLAGVLLFPAIALRRWLSVASCIVLAAGAAYAAYAVYIGDITGDEPLA